jgi:hypothetical protein
MITREFYYVPRRGSSVREYFRRKYSGLWDGITELAEEVDDDPEEADVATEVAARRAEAAPRI